tara:strand:- start:50 stop:238 length:189 start_codon:yes stop_codon:yes gene_type:complete
MLPFWRVEMSDSDNNFDVDEIDPTGGCGWDSISDDDVDSEDDWNDERQPDEAQEWHDFDPDC